MYKLHPQILIMISRKTIKTWKKHSGKKVVWLFLINLLKSNAVYLQCS